MVDLGNDINCELLSAAAQPTTIIINCDDRFKSYNYDMFKSYNYLTPDQLRIRHST